MIVSNKDQRGYARLLYINGNITIKKVEERVKATDEWSLNGMKMTTETSPSAVLNNAIIWDVAKDLK